jgi:mono/diheme cytochrome c family protein
VAAQLRKSLESYLRRVRIIRMGTFVERCLIARIALVVALLAGCILPRSIAETPGDRPRTVALSPKDAAVSFEQRVLPLLKQKCFACHGADAQKIKGELDLHTRAGMLKGGKSGSPALMPGDPDKSPLYVAVTRRNNDLAMPPKENDKLTAAEVEVIRAWVAAGAPWSDVSAPSAAAWDNSSKEGVTVVTSGGLSPEWTQRKYKPEDLWAYRPLKHPTVPLSPSPPKLGDGAPLLNPIDAFLQQKQKEKGIERSAPPADKRTLLRRATFDLIGLPPSPEEVDAFLNDRAPDAFERAIARLLQSPHYGEQWARHWLDVARYADTSGFANDYERPNAWRYRDYVVRSFNQDKPYDRFILEQLSGDEIDPKNPELLIAAGFLRMGPWEHTPMSVAVETRQQFLDDVTHHVGVVFLGQALRCARCHDHKFDPLPTRDYYRMQAVFAPVQFADRPMPYQPYENISAFAEGRRAAERRLQAARDFREGLHKKSEDAIAAYLKERGVAKLADLSVQERPKKRFFGLSKLELSLEKISQKRVDYFERGLKRYQPFAFSVYDGPPNNYISTRLVNPMPARHDGAVQVVHILRGGSLESPAEAVTPGALSAVFGRKDAAGGTIPETMTGRRLALARWIASPNNTFTARVLVNRVWQYHFGKGIVATPNNFGKMGKRPTHPELLDWLANWFVENGWSIKKLHRLIMTSAAYQQSGHHPDGEKLRQIDANNDWLAYFSPRRLEAEEIRDSMLSISGELNREIGGPGVFPEINWEVALQPRHIMGSVAPAYQPSPRPQERNRRTLYTFRRRSLSEPMLEAFDQPGSEISCERREQTTVTPQVFALFNSAFVHDRALALAVVLEKRADSADGRIERAFRWCYGRAPTASEKQMCREHLTRMTDYHQHHKPIPTKPPARVRRKMVEEMTGEEFEWEEELDGLRNYQGDVKPWDVGPPTRALADLCLVLLNSNEFLYVR